MSERIRGRRLQHERSMLFDDEPLCRRCRRKDEPRDTAATQRDHIVPHFKLDDHNVAHLTPAARAQAERDADMPIDELLALIRSHGPDIAQNLQPLCDDCHQGKTLEDLGIVAKGCDVDGMPTDPSHPWNRASR